MDIPCAYQPDYHLYPSIPRPHRNTQTGPIYMRRSLWSWQINQMTPCSRNVNIVKTVIMTYWSHH